MCLPLAPALLVASTVVTMAGQAASAMSQAGQASYEAGVARRNAAMRADAAHDARERGQVEARNYQLELGQRMGSQRASLAANGIDPGYGSAADVQADMARAGATDVDTIRRNAAREEQGYLIDASNFTSEAVAQRRRRTAAYVSGAFGIAQTALGAASQYGRMKGVGA